MTTESPVAPATPNTATASQANAAPEVPASDPNAGKEKYVVNGKDVWLTPSERTAWIQKGMAFEPRISELASLRQETTRFLDVLKTEPEKVLFNKSIGHTPEKVLEKILSILPPDKVMEALGPWYTSRGKMTPEQLETERIKQENAAFKAEKEKAVKDAEERANQDQINRALAQVKAQISEAMKEAGLPTGDGPLAIQLAKRVADVMRIGYFQKKAVTPKEAIEKVKSEIREFQKTYISSLDEEKMVEFIGKENADKIRKHFLKLVQGKETKGNTEEVPATSRKGRKIMTPDDMKEYLDKVKRGES